MKKLLLATVSAVVLSTMPSFGAATSDQENIRIKWGRNLTDSLTLVVHGSNILDKAEITEENRSALIRTFINYIVLENPVGPTETIEPMVDINSSHVSRWKEFNEKYKLSKDELNYCRDLLMGKHLRLRFEDVKSRDIDLQNNIFPHFLINKSIPLNKDEMYQMLTHETGFLRKLSLHGVNTSVVNGAIEALSHPNCKLTFLELSWMDLYFCVHIKAMVAALPNSQLTSLRIGCDNAGLKAIAAVLPESKLTTLDVESMFLSEDVQRLIAEALPNSKLTSLKLHCTEGGVKAIAAILPESKLTTLDLGHINLSEDALHLIAEALRNPNCKLEKITLVRDFYTWNMTKQWVSEFPHIDFDFQEYE
jgi:hypothetical protein